SFKYKDPMKTHHGGYADKKYIILKFFKGEQITMDAEQIGEFNNRVGSYKISKLDPEVHFKDGSSLTYHAGFSPKLCLVPEIIKSYLVKTDNNKQEKKYSILGTLPQVNVLYDEARCEVQGAPFFYQRIELLRNLIDLGDDTFITYLAKSGLMI